MADPFATSGTLPITTPGLPVYRDRFLSDYTAPSRDVLGAWYGQAIEDWPLNQIDRWRRIGEAEHGLPTRAGTYPGGPGFKTAPDTPLLTAEDAKKQVEARRLLGQIEIPEAGLRQKTLDLLMEHRIEQNRRGAIMARSPGGFALNAAGVVGTLALSALDPLNVGMAFIPVVGEARYARMLAAAGESVLARTAVRAGVGAAEGTAGAALLEPLHAMAAAAYQDDYTMNDAAANVLFGGLFGATLHQLPAAAGWVADKFRKGVPLEYRRAAASEALSAFLEDRQPRVSEMMEGIRRGDLRGSTALSSGARFDPTMGPGRFEPEAVPAARVPEEDFRARRATERDARARELAPQAFAEVDRLIKERETYGRWIDELRVTRDKEIDAQITRAKEQIETAPNARKAKTYRKRLEELEAEKAKRGDTPDMAGVRKKMLAADIKMRDLATTISAAKRRAEVDVPEPTGLNESLHSIPDREDLAPVGLPRADAPRETFDAAMRATAPDLRAPAQDPRSLTGVLTQIRDDRVNLPPDDAKLAAETARQTPAYNKPATPEAAETELAEHAAATDEALAVMQASGRLTESDQALLAEADQMVAQAEYVGSGWKAAVACIARAFT